MGNLNFYFRTPKWTRLIRPQISYGPYFPPNSTCRVAIEPWTVGQVQPNRGSQAVMAMPVRSVRSHLVQTDPIWGPVGSQKQNFSPELIFRSIKIRPRSPRSKILASYWLRKSHNFLLSLILASTQRYIDSALFKFNPWLRRDPKNCKNDAPCQKMSRRALMG